MQHCGLPELPGRPPFGGEIMSHDFVEAAFLRRAGWDVWMAPDIGGSFEEPPPSLLDHLIRDRRWCQGNLQHLRIVFAQGLTLPSRLHLAMGIMSYVSSPLWLLLLVVSAIDMMSTHPAAPATYIGLLPSLPLYVSRRRTGRAGDGDPGAAVRSQTDGGGGVAGRSARPAPMAAPANCCRGLFWESLFSTLMAPVVMLQHSWYVLTILVGIATGWNSQTRTDRALPLGFVAGKFAPHTLIGAVCCYILWNQPGFGWFVPLWRGWCCPFPWW